jgi:hypothetical protein
VVFLVFRGGEGVYQHALSNTILKVREALYRGGE